MAAENGPSPGENDVDELMDTLSHPLRRDIIRYFEGQPTGATASLEELVIHIESMHSTKTKEELWKSLYQVHIPTLQSRGWLVFDTEHELVSYYGHEVAEQLLEEVQNIFKK